MISLEEFLNMISVHELRRLAKSVGAWASTDNDKEKNIIFIAQKIRKENFSDLLDNLIPSERTLFEKYLPFLKLYGKDSLSKKNPSYETINSEVINRQARK